MPVTHHNPHKAHLRRLHRVLSMGAALATFFLHGGQLAAQTLLVTPPGQIETEEIIRWSSTAVNTTEFGDQLSQLYLTLFNTGRLTVRIYTVEEMTAIKELLSDKKVYLGSFLPNAIESLVCDLNRHVCTRDRSRTPLLGWAGSIDHTLMGSLPTLARWSYSSGTPMVLPDIQLRRVARWTTMHKPGGVSLESLVLYLGGCETFNQRCKDDIFAFNRSVGDEILNARFAGILSLPVLAATATIDLRSAKYIRSQDSSERFQYTFPLDPSLKLTRLESGLFKVDSDWNPFLAESMLIGERPVDPLPDPNIMPDPVEVEKARQVMEGAAEEAREAAEKAAEEARLEVFRKLEVEIAPHRLPVPHFEFPFSSEASVGEALYAQDFEQERERLDGLISFPFVKPSEYPPDFQGGTVAVFDGWIDPRHCALSADRVKVVNIAARPRPKDVARCETMVKADTVWDYGTHVVGLIGGFHSEKLGFGLNPYAKIYAYQVDFATLPKAASKAAEDIANHLYKLQREGVDVVNMSFGYYLPEGGQDRIEAAILGLERGSLLVAAAGNHGLDKSHICDVRPACFDLPNVISVAGLNASKDAPDLLTEKGQVLTNYGDDISIGAVGSEVFSTIAFGRYGRLSGSSQAAPQVTAVASMLLRKYRKMTPQEVKNRLIYCSDSVAKFQGKLFGGRLNADCVLAGDFGRLQLVSDPIDASPRLGHFLAGSTLQFTNADSGREVSLPAEGVRGIEYDEEGGTFIVFYNQDQHDTDSRLLKESRLVVPDKENVLRFQPAGNVPAYPVPVVEIRKFASGVN